MKKILSFMLAILMVFTTLSCLSVVTVAADAPTYEAEVEDNGTNTDAQEIEVDKTYAGSLSSETDIDWYVFENTEDYFEVTLSYADDISTGSINNGWTMYIYSENDLVNCLVERNYMQDSYTTPRLPYSGKIYVKITNTYRAVDACYSLKAVTTTDPLWENENNNTYPKANEMTVGSAYNGAMMNESDADWFVFENTEDYFVVNLAVNTAISTGEIGNGWTMYIYSENDLVNCLVERNYMQDSYTTPRLPYSGKIYVKITNTYRAVDADTYYSLKVDTTTDLLWESENNDAYLKANEITIGDAYNGAMMNESDTDWFVFENTEDYFVVNLAVNTAISTGEIGNGWTMYIYSENDLVNCLVERNYMEDSYTTPRLPYSGKIYVKITNTYRAVDADTYYSLKVDTTTDPLWESENNDAYLKANKTTAGKAYSGAMMNESDVDWFVFENKSGYIEATLSFDPAISTGNVNNGWSLAVYSEKDMVKPLTEKSYIKDSYTTPRLPCSGKMYIKITNTYRAVVSDAYYSLKVIHTPATPKVTTTNEIGGVQVKWNAVDSATKYVVYRRQGGSNAWVNIGTTTGTMLLDKNVKSGIYYVYSVRAYNSIGKYSDFVSANTQTRKYMATPKLTTIYNHTNGLAIKWNAVAGVTKGYRVYRRGAGSTYWTYLGTTKNLYFIDSQVKAKSGEYFRYTVIADGGYHSKFDTTGLYLKRLANPTLTSAVSSNAGITVKWGAVKGTTGYYVYRKTANSGWTRIAAVGGTNTTTYLDKTAKKGTTYTYTVRAVYGATTSAYNAGISCYDKY